MTARRFGALDLNLNTNTVLMTSANNFDSTCNIRMVNRNSSPVRIRIALVDDIAANALTSLSDEDYLEYDIEIRANGVLENTGIVVPENHSIVVRADTSNVTAICFGFEEQIS